MHSLYSEVMDLLCAEDEALHHNFQNSSFTATTVNYGPYSVCNDHTDSHNLPFGWCVVNAAGNFDLKHGGHLVLWDLGIAIEFSPGACIFLPSALLVHSNVAIQKGEERYSFTSYSAGVLFRWVGYGCQSEASYMEEMTTEEQKKWKEDRAEA